MASSNHRTVCLLLWACALGACSGSEKRFPLREPLWRDTDLDPRSVSCEKRPTEKDREHWAFRVPVCKKNARRSVELRFDPRPRSEPLLSSLSCGV
jgi:hypothetical protein